MSDDESDVISEIDKDDSISNSDEEDNETIDDVKIPKEFQENVVKFVKIDDLIRKKQEEMSELKKQKKPCEEFILKYLDKTDLNTIEITDGKLRKNKSETKKALNNDIIKETLTEFLKDPIKVEEALKKLEDKRPLNTHTNLKRTGKREKKTDKKVTKKK